MKCETCIHEEVCYSVAECLNHIPGFTCDRYRPVASQKFSKWKVNLNEWIKVKLNDKGKDIYYHQYDATNRRIEMLGGKKIEPSMPKVDAEGYTQFQMWEFVKLYGEHFEAFAIGGGILESLDIIIMGGEPVEEGEQSDGS